MAQQLNPAPDEVAKAELSGMSAKIPADLKPVHDELTELRRMLGKLCELAAPLTEPAQPTFITLTAQTPRKRAYERGLTTASFGVLNTTGVTVLVGIGGEPATTQARAIAVPPESLLVLPVAVGEVEIATEAALGEDTAVVHLFRYRTVQPAFLGGV
jgi:hypothetical protein